MTVEKRTKQEHPSYGMLKIARTRGGNPNLFGSSIPHDEKIEITISHGYVERDLNNDWYHSKGRRIIEIEMSPSQFAEAITSLNMGSGIPCTILYEDGKKIEACDFTDKRKQFDNEMETKAKELYDVLNKLTADTEEILNNKKSITKGDRETIQSGIDSLKQEILFNLPFMLEQFQEQMDKTVVEAKMAIEATIQRKVRELGVQSLEDFQNIQLIDNKQNQ